MPTNMEFLSYCNIISNIIPVDLQTAANNGDWVNMRDYDRVLAVLFKAAGTAGDDPVLTPLQATSASGTGSKAINFSKIWKKVGTQTGIGTWTITTQTAAATYTDTDSAEAQALMCIEFKGEDFDVANGFTFFSLTIPDTGGNAQLGCSFYIMVSNKYPQTNPITAIA